MKEEKPYTCRTLSASRKEKNFPSFISINTPQPKMRIKIPKLLAKAMQRRNQNHRSSDTDEASENKKKKKKWAKPGNLFPKKVNSMVQIVFGNKKIEGGEANHTEKDGFFSKSNGLGFKFKGKSNKPCNGSGEGKLGRVQSRKNRKVRSMREKKAERNGREREERGEEELCKKRILMGEKCRPLNLSGALHYDKNGVLLPEEVQ